MYCKPGSDFLFTEYSIATISVQIYHKRQPLYGTTHICLRVLWNNMSFSQLLLCCILEATKLSQWKMKGVAVIYGIQ